MSRPIAAGRRLAATNVFTRDGVRTVELVDVRWVDPVHLVAVAAEAAAAHRDGLGFRLRGPSAADRSRYAARMQLGRVVTELGGTHDLVEPSESERHEHLVEVAQLNDPRDVDRLAGLVHDRVLDRDLAHALHQGVAEIGQNVCDHARSVGFVAAQTIPRRGELRFAVADPGIGLLETLRPRGAATDEDAIELALAGVSSTGRRGTGLPSTVGTLTRLGGHFYLASGSSSTAVTALRAISRDGPSFRGTIVEGRVPTRPMRGTMDTAVRGGS